MTGVIRRYNLALIPCSERKNPVGSTARSLYRGAGFSLMMRHAAQNSERILILSARHGLLSPEDEVHWYNTYLPNLNQTEKSRLVLKIKQQLVNYPWSQGTIISYLPEAYYRLMEEVDPLFASKIARPYKGVRLLSLYKTLALELDNYGKNPARR